MVLAGVDESEYMRVLKLGGEPDLGQEPIPAQRSGQLGTEDLECDLTVVLEIVGEIHVRHPALAQFAVEAVAVLERGGEAGRDGSHEAHFFTGEAPLF